MRLQPAKNLALGLALVALLSHCDDGGQGDACSTLGNDCHSPLICVPSPGYLNLGKCCEPNTQCGSAQTGLVLNQDAGEEGSSDAADEGLADVLDETRDASKGSVTDATTGDGGGEGSTDAAAGDGSGQGSTDAAAGDGSGG
jgi:hypothetical protein